MECCNCGKDFELSDLTDIGGHLACFSCKVSVIAQSGQSYGVSQSAVKSKRTGNGQRNQSGTYLDYGGIWRRSFARSIDGFLFKLFAYGFGAIFGGVWGEAALKYFDVGLRGQHFNYTNMANVLVLGSIITGIYEVFFLAHKGGTIGKLICGMNVVDKKHHNLSFFRALWRFSCHNLLTALLIPVFYIGGMLPAQPSVKDKAQFTVFFIVIGIVALITFMVNCLAAFDNKKRSFHDWLAGTLVIRN